MAKKHFGRKSRLLFKDAERNFSFFDFLYTCSGSTFAASQYRISVGFSDSGKQSEGDTYQYAEEKCGYY